MSGYGSAIRRLSLFLTIILTASFANAQATAKFDFDADGKTDIALWQPSTAQWKVKRSSNGSVTTLTQGSSTTVIAPADYDNDGKTDYAGFNHTTGAWAIRRSSDGVTQTISNLGQYGDRTVSGKYDADGLSDAAIYRPSNGTWYIKQSSNGTVVSVQFGASGDIPAPGDYDGDGKNDFAVFRPSAGGFYTMYSSTSQVVFLQWGISTDTPVCADYDGDGKTDIAVFRPSTGVWHVNKSNGNVYAWKVWGNYGDQPAPADYDGDNKADFAVWRPTTGVWYIINSLHDTNSNVPEYAYEQFGAAGDIPASSAFTKQIGSPVAPYGMAKARLAPRNRTGGTDLYSQNLGWGTSLVGLPGRAGLDAGFGISYNSLVWTKQFDTMIFDADNSNVSPGFRFGFPVIEPGYYDSQTGRFAYLMVTPSGARVEFRQDAASGVYETADSSYTQLTVTEPLGGQQGTAQNLTLTVTTTDGTRMTYEWRASAYHLSQIKDRNGNFITVNHDQYGLLRSVTDTLGRIINVNYDSQHYPISITQDWKTENGKEAITTHTYATFTYANSPAINTNFFNTATSTAIPVYGPPNGTVLKVLQKITFADGSSTTFDYNGYGQVQKISNFGNNQSQPLNYTRTDLGELGTTAQADVPRLTKTYSYAANFNGGAETVIRNSYTENQTCGVANLNLPTTRTEVWMENHPNGLISKTCHFAAGTWRESLPYATEDVADNQQKRWTVTAWTQDDESLYYILNPRVGETKVGDAANVKRTVIEYLMQTGSTTVSHFGLVSAVKVYDANQTTLLKKSVTVYNHDAAYESRRIIGLPLMSQLEDGSGNPLAKMTYAYDGGDFSDTSLQQTIAPTQHDTANYGANFITGRGNLTLTLQHDVSNAATVSSQIKYNTAGAPVAQIAPGTTTGTTRQVKIGYADTFNDGGNSRNTFAYPTTVTTAGTQTSGDITSYAEYRFDIGANVKGESPGTDGTARAGKRTTRTFDSIGRLQQETLLNTNAYTRYEYFDNAMQSKVFTTAANGTGEVGAESWTDGAGRVLRSRTELPNSTGGWSGALTEYDSLGQVKRASVPTEISVNETTNIWTPTGDDNRGVDAYNNPVWLWTSQEYDWKGRVTKQTNTDGTFKSIEYAGCGCAGGMVTTVKGEEIFESDWQGNNPVSLGRRTQKIYADILGRTKRTEVLNWNNSIYSTAVTAYNGRDQAVSVKQYAGAEGTGTPQETLMSYDGFGRLATQHRPEQDAGKNTIYNYNADGSIASVMDARKAKIVYGYEHRGLVSSITTDVSEVQTGTTAPPLTAPVSFTYDALGNRISMSDGLGGTTYAYDTLSRLTTETRTINDTATNINQSFTFNYEYNLAGQLTKFIDPNDTPRNLTYERDKIGRVTALNGGGFYGVTDYASNLQYRAFGAIKSMSYGSGSGKTLTQTFNNRLQLDEFKVTGGSSTLDNLASKHKYYADGQIKSAGSITGSGYSDNLDRLYKYDHLGRITEARSGIEARDQTQASADRPYRQTYGYNAFSNLTNRTGKVWSTDVPAMTATYANNRNAATGASAWTYDADGRELWNDDSHSKYDASGRRYRSEGDPFTITQGFDGDGQRIKQREEKYNYDVTRYYIRSSVLGNVYELNRNSGNNVWFKQNGMVYLNGQTIAVQKMSANGSAIGSPWVYENPLTGATRSNDVQMGSEPDPIGVNNGVSAPPIPYDTGDTPGNIIPHFADPLNLSGGCEWGGMPMSCDAASRAGDILGIPPPPPAPGDPGAPEPGHPGAPEPGHPGAPEAVSGGMIFASDKGGNPTEPTFPFPVAPLPKEPFTLATVQSERAKNDPDKSTSTLDNQPQQRKTVPVPSKARLRELIVERLDRNGGKCRQFIDAVRKNLDIDRTIEQLFDEVIKNGGNFVAAPDISAAGQANYGKNGKNVGLKPKTNEAAYVNTSIHELIHRADIDKHKAFAVAAFKFLSAEEQKANPLPTKEGPGDRSMNDTYSTYFSKLINEYCRPE